MWFNVSAGKRSTCRMGVSPRRSAATRRSASSRWCAAAKAKIMRQLPRCRRLRQTPPRTDLKSPSCAALRLRSPSYPGITTGSDAPATAPGTACETLCTRGAHGAWIAVQDLLHERCQRGFVGRRAVRDEACLEMELPRGTRHGAALQGEGGRGLALPPRGVAGRRVHVVLQDRFVREGERIGAGTGAVPG